MKYFIIILLAYLFSISIQSCEHGMNPTLRTYTVEVWFTSGKVDTLTVTGYSLPYITTDLNLHKAVLATYDGRATQEIIWATDVQYFKMLEDENHNNRPIQPEES